MLLQHGHAGDYARLAACGKRVQLKVGRDECGCELSVGCGTGASAPNLRGNVMQLLAVFVGDDRARGGTGIGCDLVVRR